MESCCIYGVPATPEEGKRTEGRKEGGKKGRDRVASEIAVTRAVVQQL